MDMYSFQKIGNTIRNILRLSKRKIEKPKHNLLHKGHEGRIVLDIPLSEHTVMPHQAL